MPASTPARRTRQEVQGRTFIERRGAPVLVVEWLACGHEIAFNVSAGVYQASATETRMCVICADGSSERRAYRTVGSGR